MTEVEKARMMEKRVLSLLQQRLALSDWLTALICDLEMKYYG